MGNNGKVVDLTPETPYKLSRIELPMTETDDR